MRPTDRKIEVSPDMEEQGGEGDGGTRKNPRIGARTPT